MDGEPFHTEYMGCLLRGVQCTDAGGGQAPVTPKERFPGTPRWEAAVPIHPTLTYIYDGCTDIVSDIHTSPRFAHGAGLPDIILQVTATIALGVREVINRELHGDPEVVELIGAKLTGMVFPGDQLSVRLCDRRRQHGRTELFFEVLLHDRKVCLLTGMWPRAPEYANPFKGAKKGGMKMNSNLSPQPQHNWRSCLISKTWRLVRKDPKLEFDVNRILERVWFEKGDPGPGGLCRLEPLLEIQTGFA